MGGAGGDSLEGGALCDWLGGLFDFPWFLSWKQKQRLGKMSVINQVLVFWN